MSSRTPNNHTPTSPPSQPRSGHLFTHKSHGQHPHVAVQPSRNRKPRSLTKKMSRAILTSRPVPENNSMVMWILTPRHLVSIQDRMERKMRFGMSSISRQLPMPQKVLICRLNQPN